LGLFFALHCLAKFQDHTTPAQRRVQVLGLEKLELWGLHNSDIAKTLSMKKKATDV
jgi:hypothetical protein